MSVKLIKRRHDGLNRRRARTGKVGHFLVCLFMFIFLCTYGALSVSSITWVMQSTKGKWRCASQRMFLTLICVCGVRMYPRKPFQVRMRSLAESYTEQYTDIVHSTEPQYCTFLQCMPRPKCSAYSAYCRAPFGLGYDNKKGLIDMFFLHTTQLRCCCDRLSPWFDLPYFYGIQQTRGNEHDGWTGIEWPFSHW